MINVMIKVVMLCLFIIFYLFRKMIATTEGRTESEVEKYLLALRVS